jgi:hypothetical protein
MTMIVKEIYREYDEKGNCIRERTVLQDGGLGQEEAEKKITETEKKLSTAEENLNKAFDGLNKVFKDVGNVFKDMFK